MAATLADLNLAPPVTYAWAQGKSLVFSAALAVRLAEIQAEHGDPRHVPAPRMLADGRYMLSADILTECLPGGLVYGGFSRLDPSRFNEIEIVDAASLVFAPQPVDLAT